MTYKECISQLKAISDVYMSSGVDENNIRKLSEQVNLPAAHLDCLRITNGVCVFGGYFRIFGCRSPVAIDMLQWNSPNLWSFAWNKPLSEFWFFGETAWGDQYAYRRDELHLSANPRIFLLEGITMNAEVIAEDFEAFVEHELLRNARQPYDINTVAARNKIGELAPLEHVAYIPSPLVTGEEDVDSASKMDAVASMIINGDLCNQLADQEHGRAIRELRTYNDSDGRTRLRVIWR